MFDVLGLMFDEKRKQTRRSASLRRDSGRGVAGEEHAAYRVMPCLFLVV
jgi:hypothetical protein